ncbi:MAG: septation protein SepH [Mycobacteriales bacterium]
MRELHVVALSEDGRSVLLATSRTAGTGGFRLKLDDRLAAALRGELPRPGESAAREIGVTPKDIQTRMRAGESVEEIASSAGVPVARIERFAGPVLSEREQIIEQARKAFLSRGRLGPSQLPLGDAVDAALAETPSLRPETVSWTTRRLESGHWLVQVSYVSRARSRTASWVYDPGTRAIVPSDPASAALGHAGEVNAPRAATPRPAATRPRPVAKKAAPKKRKRARAAAGTRAAKPAGKPAAAPPPPAAAAKKKKPAAPKKAAAPKAAAPKAARVEPESPPTLRVVPAPPAELTPTPTPKRRTAGERATVPDWADVLFGATPRNDG